jgi:hypothetical protein
VTYFIGCYSLPALLTYLDFEVCRLGKTTPEDSMYFTKSFAIRGAKGKDSTVRSDGVVDEGNSKSASDSSHELGHKEALESLEEEEIE